LAPLAVIAQSDKPFAAPAATVASAPSAAAGLAQVTLSLLLVLAAVFAVAWLVRRARELGKFGASAITVIADVGLGPKERAVLVQVGGKQLLLGVAPGRVSTLHVLDEPVVAPSPQPAPAVTEPALGPDFKAILKRSLGLK
jgi:flagellar protein FliO/FliZ